jgi:type IV secretory pathway VirB9-like protein
MRQYISVALIVAASVSAGAQSAGVREITATDQSVIALDTRIRFSSMIILPDGEEILDVVCGDRDFWVISATHNIAHVKPAKEKALTNLNLVTASGAVYSFLLKEGSLNPDIKVYVHSDKPTVGRAKYYTAEQMQAAEAELASAKAASVAVLERAEQSVAAQKVDYPKTLRFPYQPIRYTRPFYISSAWTDGQFSYFKTDARELPALYELKDGQPSIVNFTVPKPGLYVVPKLVDSGYFQLGKQKLAFAVRDGE